jgi:hypothetical protein
MSTPHPNVLVTVTDFEALPEVVRVEPHANGPGTARIVVEPGTDTDAIQARSVTGAVLEFAEESRADRWAAFTDGELVALEYRLVPLNVSSRALLYPGEQEMLDEVQAEIKRRGVGAWK